jgi:hypothetical protein
VAKKPVEEKPLTLGDRIRDFVRKGIFKDLTFEEKVEDLEKSEERREALTSSIVNPPPPTTAKQFAGGVLENIIMRKPSEGLGLQAPIKRIAPEDRTTISNVDYSDFAAFGGVAPPVTPTHTVQNPFQPFGTEGTLKVMPPIDPEGRSFDAPARVALEIGLVMPDPMMIKKGKLGFQAIKFSKRADLLTEARDFGKAKKVGTTGEIVGAPRTAGGKRAKSMAANRKFVEKLVKEGESGKMWYELSGEQILYMANGNVEEAKKLAGLLAIYSGATEVKGNATNALKAWYRYLDGEAIWGKFFKNTGDPDLVWHAPPPTAKEHGLLGRFASQDEKAQRWIYEGMDTWDAPKTRNFYINLMRNIDAVEFDAVKQGATVDRWMARAFGVRDNPSPQQYATIEREIASIAKEMGMEPHQAQAAIWISTKARWEKTRKAAEAAARKKGWVTGKGENKVITEPTKFNQLWRQMARRVDIEEGDVEKAGASFATALRAHAAQVSYETLPGISTGKLPGLYTAPYEVLAEYHQAKSRVLLRTMADGQEVDRIAEALRLPRQDELLGVGAFEGRVQPGGQVQVIAAKRTGGAPQVPPEVARRLDAYATIRASLLDQEAVPWHVLFPGAGPGSKNTSNAVKVTLGRRIRPDEMQKFYNNVARAFDDAGFPHAAGDIAPIFDGDGARFLNLEYLRSPSPQPSVSVLDVGIESGQARSVARGIAPEPLTNDAFQRIVSGAVKKTFGKRAKTSAKWWDGSGGPSGLSQYVHNDYGEFAGAEAHLQYLKSIDENGEFMGVYRQLVDELGPVLRQVDDEFLSTYPQAGKEGSTWLAKESFFGVAHKVKQTERALGAR